MKLIQTKQDLDDFQLLCAELAKFALPTQADLKVVEERLQARIDALFKELDRSDARLSRDMGTLGVNLDTVNETTLDLGCEVRNIADALKVTKDSLVDRHGELVNEGRQEFHRVDQNCKELSKRIDFLEKQVAQGHHIHGAQILSTHLVDKRAVLGFLNAEIKEIDRTSYLVSRFRGIKPPFLTDIATNFCKLFNVKE